MIYVLKNVHEHMVITNVTIRDTFVSSDQLKFDVIHGRAGNFEGGIDRERENIYVDAAIKEREK